jgi:hypothetical protein
MSDPSSTTWRGARTLPATIADYVAHHQKYILRRILLGALWSVFFFALIIIISVVVTAARASLPAAIIAATGGSFEVVWGIKIANAVRSLIEAHVFIGIAFFSVALGIFGAMIQTLPNTNNRSIQQHLLLQEYQNSVHIRFDSTCPNCNAKLTGRFCAECGQEKIESSELTLGGFILHAINDVLNIDGRFFRSLRLLLTKPGFLTNEYLRVRRASYTTPTQIYLLVTVVFFFASVRLDFDVDTLVKQIPTLSKNITQRATAQHVTPEVIIDRMDDSLENYIPFYTLFIIIFFAFFLRLVYRAWYYVEHLVFALHFISVVMMVWIVAIGIQVIIPAFSQNLSLLFVMLGSTVYLVMALRHVHPSDSWWRIVPSVLAFFVLMAAYTAITIALAMFVL